MKKLSLICCFIPLLLLSQESDFQSWSKVGVQYKIHKKLSTTLSQGYRLRENASLPDKGFTTLAVVYKIDKDFKLGVGYRLNENYDLAQRVTFQNRYFTDIYLRKKHKKWTFKDRLRYQNQANKYALRNKAEVTYNIRKTPLEPYLAVEAFYNFEVVNKLRYTLGASYPINKKINFDLYYRIQDEVNENKSNDLYILGASLKLEI